MKGGIKMNKVIVKDGVNYSKDFLSKIRDVECQLEKSGVICYDDDTQEFNDTFFFEEDIDYILSYLKDNFQKRKCLYKVNWNFETLGIVVGKNKLFEFVNDWKKRFMADCEFDYYGIDADIKEASKELSQMYDRGASQDEKYLQEIRIDKLKEDKKNYWNNMAAEFKSLLETVKIR